MSDDHPTPKTVFIIGAGASKEVGLPIGSELKGVIAEALDLRFERLYRRVSGDGHIFEALQLAAAKEPARTDLLNSFQRAGWRIRDAMPLASSIDNFIDTHSADKEIELCGKLAIVRTILEAESKSDLIWTHYRATVLWNLISLNAPGLTSFSDTSLATARLRILENV